MLIGGRCAERAPLCGIFALARISFARSLQDASGFGRDVHRRGVGAGVSFANGKELRGVVGLIVLLALMNDPPLSRLMPAPTCRAVHW